MVYLNDLENYTEDRYSLNIKLVSRKYLVVIEFSWNKGAISEDVTVFHKKKLYMDFVMHCDAME